MPTFAPADTLHRLVKQALDSGAASSLAQAEAMFRGYHLTFAIEPRESHDPLHQAALLTGVALARRVFLGGVSVTGALEAALPVPMPLGATLSEAIVALGGSLAAQVSGGPLVTIGGGPRPQCAGWHGGIVPAHAEAVPAPGPAMPLAAMLSVALAVNEAFLYAVREAGAAAVVQLGYRFGNHPRHATGLVVPRMNHVFTTCRRSCGSSARVT